jgi:hypothetical protein
VHVTQSFHFNALSICYTALELGPALCVLDLLRKQHLFAVLNLLMNRLIKIKQDVEGLSSRQH